MSRLQHTPGPWRVESSFPVEGPPVCRVVGNSDAEGYGDDIARVTTLFDGGRAIEQAEWYANARLMAAAPEMQDAIRFALERMAGPPDFARIAEAQARLQAALDRSVPDMTEVAS